MTEPVSRAPARAREGGLLTPLEEVHERIEAGVAWLTGHDPDGSFYFWFKAGITARTPMPAQTPERIEEWKRWYGNMLTFQDLWRRMERLEAQQKGTTT